MKRFFATGCLGAGLLSVQLLAAQVSASPVVDLSLTSNSAAVEARQLHQARGSQWSVGAARNSEFDATLASLAYNVVGEVAAVDHLFVGLGWKAMYHNTFESAFSLAVGGFVRYDIPTIPGLSVEGAVDLAPEVLSTDQVERYRELSARVTYQLYPRAAVFAGWQIQDLRFDDAAPVQEIEIADGAMVGFSLAF